MHMGMGVGRITTGTHAQRASDEDITGRRHCPAPDVSHTLTCPALLKPILPLPDPPRHLALRSGFTLTLHRLTPDAFIIRMLLTASCYEQKCILQEYTIFQREIFLEIKWMCACVCVFVCLCVCVYVCVCVFVCMCTPLGSCDLGGSWINTHVPQLTITLPTLSVKP